MNEVLKKVTVIMQWCCAESALCSFLLSLTPVVWTLSLRLILYCLTWKNVFV